MIRLPPHQTLFKHEHEQFCGHWKYSKYMLEVFRFQVILKHIEYKNIVNFLCNNNNKYLFFCQKEAFRFNFMFITFILDMSSMAEILLLQHHSVGLQTCWSMVSSSSMCSTTASRRMFI